MTDPRTQNVSIIRDQKIPSVQHIYSWMKEPFNVSTSVVFRAYRFVSLDSHIWHLLAIDASPGYDFGLNYVRISLFTRLLTYASTRNMKITHPTKYVGVSRVLLTKNS